MPDDAPLDQFLAETDGEKRDAAGESTTESPTPAAPTVRVAVEGVTCESCDASVTRLWAREPDDPSGPFVCGACKEW